MTLKPQAPGTVTPSAFAMTARDLRRHARASGREVWDQVSGTNVYTSFDRPGVVRTREEVRAHRNTFMMHTSPANIEAPF